MLLATTSLPLSAPAQLPPGVFAGEPNAALAPAGAYAIDPDHTSVLAKVSHIGYAMSVFRFDKVSGKLAWNPAQPSASTLQVSVQTASIATPVAGFSAELSGAGFLNTAAFPTATFVSTSFQRTDATHGKVTGVFTMMGQTRPLTLDVTLMGAGKGFMGHPRLGVQAIGSIDPREFGMSPANPVFAHPIQLEIDAEFAAS